MTTLTDLYDERVAEGHILRDPAQEEALPEFERIRRELAEAPEKPKRGLFRKAKVPEPPKGLYLWGGVGRGKSMLMDLFVDSLGDIPSRRVHFHAFMGEVPERIGEHRRAHKNGEAKGDDPIPPVAAAIAAKSKLLCFDEFAVTDIADAMILSRLFKALFANGLILVATSNVAPDDLYPNGLNWPLFLPFVAVLKQHAEVFELVGEQDYRLAFLGEDDIYVDTADPAAASRIDAAWQRLLDGAKETSASLSVKGRTISVSRAGNGAARFSFEDLLKRPLGAQDYLALARRFHTVIVENVPVMAEAEPAERISFCNALSVSSSPSSGSSGVPSPSRVR